MSRVVAVVCIILVLLAVPLWLLMVGFSPALLAGQAATASKASKLFGNTIVTAIWVVPPLWVLYFGWRMIRSWRTGPAGAAVMMAVPAICILGLMIWINFGSVAS